MIRLNRDVNFALEVKKKVIENGGYCPCSLLKNEDTKCMCKAFREQVKDPNFVGECHCGLYEVTK